MSLLQVIGVRAGGEVGFEYGGRCYWYPSVYAHAGWPCSTMTVGAYASLNHSKQASIYSIIESCCYLIGKGSIMYLVLNVASATSSPHRKGFLR
jgi:cytochrome c biogenesis protein CcdA